MKKHQEFPGITKLATNLLSGTLLTHQQHIS